MVTAVAYYPSLKGGFVLDDTWLLTDNPLIKAPDGLLRFWNIFESHDAWPMTNTSFWLEWRLWGMSSSGYHVTNLLLHIGEACLIWSILERLAIPGALLAALLFAVHPVNVESVAWISQRKNLLALLFLLLSIRWYVGGATEAPTRRRSIRSNYDAWYWLSLIAFVLAMLSKGSVAVLPLILLGITWWQRPLTRTDFIRTAPFFAVSFVLVPLNIWLQTRVMDPALRPGLIERVAGAGAVIWFYLYKALLPVHLVFVYPQWHIRPEQPSWWVPLIAAAGVTILLWWYRESWGRPLLFAWGYFVVALAPVLGLTDITFMEHTLVADHYQHVALIGVVALAGAGWGTWKEHTTGMPHWLPSLTASAVVCVLGILTWRQAHIYTDSLTLYQTTLQQNPESWMMRNNLCSVLSDAGRLDEAIEHCEYALRLKPDEPSAHNNLGNALLGRVQTQQALDHFKEALRLRPDFPQAHNNLGNALRDGKQTSQAIEHYQEALHLKPDYAAAHDNWGMALAQSGHPDEAVRQFEESLRLDPNSYKAHNNLGITLAQLNRTQEAIDQFELALRINPNFSEARRNLGIALDMKKKAAGAAE